MILDILTVLCLVSGLALLFSLIKQRRRDREPSVAQADGTATLMLRLVGPNEYAVIEDGNPVGEIMRAGDRHREIWLWHCSLPGHGVASGRAASLEEAQHQFRLEWKRRKIVLQLEVS
jgi:hypothetical protein